MNRILYSLLFYLALPFIYIRLLIRSVRAPAYRQRWLERLGFYHSASVRMSKGLGPEQKNLVIHAVSVGEVHASVPFIGQIQARYPRWNIVLTTSTPTGSARVKAIFADTLLHVYLPYDLPGAVQRFLAYANPDMLIIMETELWPNLIHYSQQRGAKVLLANARLSTKSLKGYLKGGALVKEMLKNISMLAAQSESDGARFVQLGLPAAHLQVTGTMKFDLELNSELTRIGATFKQMLGTRKVLVAGSTREGEEEKVLQAFERTLTSHPDLLLVLVPRHPERFDDIYTLIEQRGLQVVRRSDGDDSLAPSVQVLLGDTMGEMLFYYALADLAFVGGSLVDTGCQNIIEPAALALPVITGPSLFNFKSISDMLVEAVAMKVVSNAEELSTTIISLIEDDTLRQQMANNARDLTESNRGATQRVLSLVEDLLADVDG